MLVKKGLFALERRAALTLASCPFCGLPLVGTGQGVFVTFAFPLSGSIATRSGGFHGNAPFG